MSEFLDWAKMSISGDLSMLNSDILDVSENMYHLAFEEDSDDIYCVEDFPTIKDPLEDNHVNLPEDTVRYVVDKAEEDCWHVRLEIDDSAFTWETDPTGDELEFTPIGATPGVLLFCEFHLETSERLSSGYVQEIEDTNVEEVLEFIVKELA